MTFLLRAIVILALGTSATEAWAGNVAPQRACPLSAEDEAWIVRSVVAWRHSVRAFGGFEPPAAMMVIFFDANCVWTSGNAFGGDNVPEWRMEAHAGMVALPGGEQIPAGVTSFATGNEEGLHFFVMSTPSVWRKGGVDGGVLGLERMMTAVLLHEASHVVQTPTYGLRIGRLEKDNALEDFNDDSMQRRFQGEAEFAASIARETELFLAAATAPNDSEARRLSREARDLMRARAAKYFVGADAFWAEAEDVWLTFEGAGQWLGYQWLTSPQGANVAASDALPGFARRSRWWSQNQGFALFMVLDRLTSGAWRAHAFGDGSQTALEMIDAALSSLASGSGDREICGG